MHGHPWIATKSDAYGGSIEESCGCNCGFMRWRGISLSDPSISEPDADDVKQMWRDGTRPANVDVNTLQLDGKFDGIKG